MQDQTFQNRPVTMNDHNNLLQIEEHMYILDDVKKPNVFRNMFPYNEIPKIPFNDRIVPHNMPKDIWITEARKKKYVFPKNNIGASVIGLVIRKENAGEIKDLPSFAKFSGKLVPIAPQDARYSVIDGYNKENAGNEIKLVSSEAFQVADAYSWVLEGRYDGYLEVELSYKNNIEKEDAPYHQFADRLTYLRYKGIPTYPIFNRDQQQFADEYDKAVEELRSEGKIAELEQKYFGESLSAYLEK